MHRALFIILCTIIGVNLYAQKQIVLINQQTNKVISFAAIVSNNYMTVSDENGRFALPNRVKKKFSIQHVSFQTIVFVGDSVKNGDTLYIEPTVYQVKEVNVNYNLLDEYCQLLSKAIHNYRTKVLIDNASLYTFYLESENDSLALEKIKSVIQINQDKKSGLSVRQDYLKQGEFWYKPNTPYLNLSTEKFILSFHALAKKPNDDDWFMPLNSAKSIKTNHYAVKIIKAYGDTLTLGVAFNDKNKQALISFNKKNLNIYEVEFRIDSLLKHNLCDIKTGKKVDVRKLFIKYFFNAHGDVQFVQYQMKVCNEQNKMVKVQGYFNKTQLSDLPIIHTIAGNYYPDNLYEQIILTGKSKLLDSIFNVEHYKGYKIPDTVGLKSADSAMYALVLNLRTGQENYYFWKKQRINTTTYTLHEIDKYYYDPMVKQIGKELNRVDVVWPFRFIDKAKEVEVVSFPTMWYRNNHLLYTSTDTITTNFNANLIFDFSELTKQRVYDSLKHFDNAKEMNQYVNKAYYDFNTELDDLIIKLSKEELGYESLCNCNALIKSALDVDNLALWFSQKSLDTLNYKYLKQQYEHIRHVYLHSVKSEKNEVLLNAFTYSMIDITKVLILLAQRKVEINNYEMASYYHFLAKYYFTIHQFDQVCRYVAMYKKMSPAFYAKQNTKVNGVYIGSKAKSYYQENCEE